MTDSLLVGLDVGTTGIVACLYDEQLTPLAEVRRRVATRHVGPGRQEQDAEALLRDAAACVHELLAGRDAATVAGIGLDHQGESVVAWDARDGRPLSPLVLWSDQRGADILDAVDASVLLRSGLPADPYFSASKMAWLCREEPAVAAAARGGYLHLGTLDAFLVDRLGGPYRTDLSTASRTQLLALGGTCWDPALLDAFGLDPRCLPEPGASFGRLGSLHHPSWPAPLPLRAQLVDQQAALAGSGCLTPGAVKATYGTGAFVLAHAGTSVPAATGGLLPTVAWSDGTTVTYAMDGGVFTAGALLEWLSSGLGLASDPAGLCSLAADVADSAGVRVLPALAGLGAPWWRPGARGVVAGLHGGVTAGHLARAALEALAQRVADILDELDELDEPTVPLPALRVDGGLSRDDLLLQLQADAAGRPVQRTVADATARGAALLAAVGAGVIEDVTAAASAVTVGPPIRPQRDAASRGRERATWRDWVAAAGAL